MKFFLRSFLAIAALLVLVACGGEKTPLATEIPSITVTSTEDPCSTNNLPAEVGKVNDLMREFDDYAALASNTPQSQLVVVIPELQRVLREAETQAVPSCLSDLKNLQIAHMKTVVQTLLSFMGNSNPALVNTGIAKARDLHVQYDIELARLLGITLTINTPAPTKTQPEPTTTPTPMVTNPGPNTLNIRSAPDLFADTPGVLLAGQSTIALGRTADNQWLLVAIPGQSGENGWVFATNVEISVNIEQIPIVTP